ncbi:MAG: hypothetical protein HY707_14460 [Ignavibacteriae bacterium]|nr:hypothetical protein [Ignavibacteriota bacterium]
MRTSMILSFLLFFVICLGLTFIGCKGEQGPAGPPGEGFTGLEGFAAGIKCATCHSSDQDTVYYVAARRYQWSTSTHAIGGRSERNAASCAGCHTTEGFQQRWREGWTTQVVKQVDNPSPPGCFACHSPHARNNFTRRDTSAVTITSFIDGVPDAVFDYGNGNICARCHQTRTSSPMSPKPNPTKTATTDTITITSNRWYPHYGVNAQMLMGTGGFQFADYTYAGSSPHTNNTILKQEGCVKCHMAEPIGGGGGVVGGHTFKTIHEEEVASPVYNLTSCRDAACHGSSFSTFDYISQSSALTGGQGVQTYIERYLDTLGTMMKDTNVVKKWTVGTPKPWLTASGTVNASASSPLRIVPASRAGALYNYFFLEHEGSFGVHNSKYAIQLLQSSIAELRKP